MRTLFLLLFSILIALPLQAEHVDRHEAERAAVRWMSSLQSGASVDAMTPVLRASDTVCYVFNFTPGGFVIVSADDAVIPVLGYAAEGAFRNYQGTPAGGFVKFVSAAVGQAIDRKIAPDERIARAWEALRNPLAFEKPAKTAAVAPLVKAMWGQDEPYNLACPDSGCDRGPGSNTKTLTGCVATSLGMIMHYHGHPLTGAGSADGFDFAASNYQWSILPNNIYTSSLTSIKNEVSEILRHIGAAVDMHYSCQASGAQLVPARNALQYNFKYGSDVTLVSRADYTSTVWNAGLKEELDNARPLVYAGLDDNIENGHAWVLDGYEDIGSITYYHMNWGWYGAYNGNFALTDLTPESQNYNNEQMAIVGIQPAESTPRLGISQTLWTAPVAGGTSVAISVTNAAIGDETAIPYTVTANNSWLSVSAPQGTTPGSFTITASDNTGSASRTGTVTVRATITGVIDSIRTITVSQAGTGSSQPALSVSAVNWQAPYTGGQSPIISISNGTAGSSTVIDYSIASSASWLTTSVVSGSTPGSVILNAAANTTGVPRTATVTVTAAGVTNSPVTIAVMQPSGSAPGDSLIVSPPAWIAPAGGGLSPYIQVSVPGKALPFSISSNAGWLTPSLTGGTTPGGFTLSATDNTGGTVRTAIVTITVTGQSVTGSPYQFAVTQTGSTTQPILTVSVTAWSVANAGGMSQSIQVLNGNPSSQQAIEYMITESLPWLTVSQPLGTTPGAFTLTAEPNASGETRTGEVQVKATTGAVLGSPWIITVTQGTTSSSSPALSVSPRFWTAPANGGISAEIAVTNSSATDTKAIPYTVSDDAEWVTVTSAIGSTPGAFQITAQANTTGATRFAVVRVVSPMTGVTGSPQDIYITQPPSTGDLPQLGLAPAIVTVSSAGDSAVYVQVYNSAPANSAPFGFEVQDNVAWIEFDILKGTAPQQLRMNIDENTGDAARTALIKITADGGVFQSPQYITVYQSARLAGSFIEIAMNSWNPGPGKVQSPTINVIGAGGASGVPYRIRTDAAWLGTTWSYGTTPGTFNIMTGANSSNTARTGRVYIADVESGIQGAEHVVTVTQQPFSGFPAMDVSLTSWEAPIGGGNSPSVSVTNANESDESVIAYNVSSDAPWLTVTESSGTTPGQFLMRAQANTLASSRNATVTVQSQTPGVLDGVQTISVRQPGYASALLSCKTSAANSPDFTARPGDRFDITVALSKSIFSNGIEDVELSFLINFDYSGLYPYKITGLNGTAWIERVGPGTVRAVIRGRSFSSGDILRLTMEVLLGNSAVSVWSLADAGTQPTVADVGLDESCAGEVLVQPRNGFVTRSDIGVANLQSVFPNPTLKSSAAVVRVEVEQPGVVDVRIYNAMGMDAGRVYTGFLGAGTHTLSVDATNLPAGVYVISMRTASGLKTTRFVVAE